jgi:hypothetical protein
LRIRSQSKCIAKANLRVGQKCGKNTVRDQNLTNKLIKVSNNRVLWCIICILLIIFDFFELFWNLKRKTLFQPRTEAYKKSVLQTYLRELVSEAKRRGTTTQPPNGNCHIGPARPNNSMPYMQQTVQTHQNALGEDARLRTTT